MHREGLSHALWLTALAALVAIGGLAAVALVIFLAADPGWRPDSTLDWSLYTYLGLPAALGLCATGLLWSARLYRRALSSFNRDLWQHTQHRG